MGKDVNIIIPDAYPDFLMWLPGTQEITRFDKHADKAEIMIKISDLIFCLDYNTANRVGENMESVLLVSKAKKILGWKCEKTLEESIKTAYSWYNYLF